MRKTREILRLKWLLGRSHRQIAKALHVGVGTPSDVAARADEANLTTWEQVDALSDDELDRCSTSIIRSGREAVTDRLNYAVT